MGNHLSEGCASSLGASAQVHCGAGTCVQSKEDMRPARLASEGEGLEATYRGEGNEEKLAQLGGGRDFSL